GNRPGVWVGIFVVHGCMSRLDWQLAASPTSIDESGTDYLYRVDDGLLDVRVPAREESTLPEVMSIVVQDVRPYAGSRQAYPLL
ncbi:hypothetical protein C0Z16_37270, partial [Paraburkholderia rhynchosiae]